MKKLQFLFILLIMAILSGCVSITYADYRDEKSAEQAIIDLKNGALIVRWYSQQKSIDEIDRLLSSEISESVKDRLKDKKTDILEERLERFEKLQNALNEKYSFSPVYYINDYDVLDFNNGKRTEVFLNDEMTIDSTIVATFDKYFYLSTDETLKDFTILNPDGSRIAAPFPSKISAPGNIFGNIIGFFTSKDQFIPVFSKWDEKLKIYYNKVIGKR